MANTIQLKRSSVANKVPDAGNVDVGEPVVNLTDKILYTKDGSGTVIVIGAGTTSNIAEGTNLYFSNARVNTAISTQTLTNATFSGDIVSNSVIKSLQASGNEGGEIQLANAVTNSTLTGPIAIDIYQNRLRFFETGGTNRGAYIDLTSAGTGASTNLIGAGTGTITNVAGVDSGSVSNAQLAAGITSSGLLTTANVTETTNLYFSNARVYSNVVSLGYITSAALSGYATNAQLASYATVSYVDNEIANLVASAPVTLDTLNELAQALGDDPNFATTTLTLIGTANLTANTALVNASAAFDKANSAYTVATSAFDSGNTKVTTVAGVTNTTISNAQIASGISSSGILTTANVVELTNLYFSNARVSTAISTQTLSNATFSGNLVTTANVRAAAYIDNSGRQLLIKDSNGLVVWGS